MVPDLKRQEVVYSFQCVRVVGHDPHLPTPFSRLEGIAYRVVPFLHDRNSRRHTVMDEHGNLEVVVAEHRRDVGQMHANLISRCVVTISLDIHFDDAAVGKKREMMSRGLV